ncbi:MAG: tRNA lysidine(34) synthetase TilS [Chthoniobacterales bacterium]|nr:tRNA lysidine(34) synthetase TilS [Chthoniobacterales bacterium]
MGTRANAVGDWRPKTLRSFPPEKRYLVGVSGGRDSVALLHWLLASGYRRLVVCHLDHRLRGRSSAADARFVKRLAQAHDLPCELGTADVRKRAAEEKQSIEAAARAARYEFFATIARRRRCHTIFLGHHADDLVETFLINLFRGAGTQGQRGIRAVATRRVANLELSIVRPLLGVWRSEIDDYVRAHRLRFRDDATNKSLEPLRNRMRLRIIPMLQKGCGRDIRSAVRRAATIAADEDAFLDEMLPPSAGRPTLKKLCDLPIALQRRAIAAWLREQRVSDISFDLVEQVRAMLDTAHGPAKVNLPGDRHARRRSGELFIEP